MDDKKKVILGDENFNENPDNEVANEGYKVNPEPKSNKEEAMEDDSLLASLMRRKNRAGQVFDEEKDKELAKEATKNVPLAIMETNEEEVRESGIEKIGEGSKDEDVNVQEADYVEEFTKGRVNLTDREKRDLRRKRGLIALLITVLIFALLFWFAPLLQKALLQSKGNSLVFKSQTGFWGPRMGIVEIALGILGIILTIFTFFGNKRISPIKKGAITDSKTTILRRIGLGVALLLPIGITNLFNFSEFRTNDVRFSSFFNGNDLKDYNNASDHKISMVGNDIIYDITLGNKKTSFAINNVDKEIVKQIDKKLNPARVVTIDSIAFQEIISKGIYNEKDALKIYKLQGPPQ